ncbi:MAG: four helix bundle protein [Gemmatimonadaceae bacterium]
MRKYQNLRVAQATLVLRDDVQNATESFPAWEFFGITFQMRRAAGSIGYCIAEGCGRNSERQFLNSLQQSSGEASELHYQLTQSVRLGYGNRTEVLRIRRNTEHLCRMLTKLQSVIQKSIRRKEAEKKSKRAPRKNSAKKGARKLPPPSAPDSAGA